MKNRTATEEVNAETPQVGPEVIADVKRLQSELDTKKKSAIDALLQQRKEIEATLMSLGYSAEGRSANRSRRSSKSAEERNCPICEVKGHDARAHRSQGKKKRKFTPEELAAMHLS